ncbi:MAG: hypothetical protein E6J90_35855 [Deltaproteobacteria bacterium]|nr:MAG: hypothetical protein E6J90_35855 [Deltaproteobacteria bacterium]
MSVTTGAVRAAGAGSAAGAGAGVGAGCTLGRGFGGGGGGGGGLGGSGFLCSSAIATVVARRSFLSCATESAAIAITPCSASDAMIMSSRPPSVTRRLPP